MEQNHVPLKEQVLGQLGGWRGLVYSTLPVVAFVPVNALAGLTWAAATSVGVALVILVIRLVTRTTVQPAVSGFFGVAICVLIALLVGGSGKGYYLYGIISQLVFAVAFAVSIVIRRPLVGVLWHVFSDGGGGPIGRADRRSRRVFTWLTVGWTLVFGVRFVIQGALYLSDRVNWLGGARIVMGWPLFGVALLVTFGVARRLPHPPVAPEPATLTQAQTGIETDTDTEEKQ